MKERAALQKAEKHKFEPIRGWKMKVLMHEWKVNSKRQQLDINGDFAENKIKNNWYCSNQTENNYSEHLHEARIFLAVLLCTGSN